MGAPYTHVLYTFAPVGDGFQLLTVGHVADAPKGDIIAASGVMTREEAKAAVGELYHVANSLLAMLGGS